MIKWYNAPPLFDDDSGDFHFEDVMNICLPLDTWLEASGWRRVNIRTQIDSDDEMYFEIILRLQE